MLFQIEMLRYTVDNTYPAPGASYICSSVACGISTETSTSIPRNLAASSIPNRAIYRNGRGRTSTRCSQSACTTSSFKISRHRCHVLSSRFIQFRLFLYWYSDSKHQTDGKFYFLNSLETCRCQVSP